ncbi:hypothetical protein BG004_004238 [Podila humilis]|nr:hypothetical protein BG004_004238 [Podila humilis]
MKVYTTITATILWTIASGGAAVKPSTKSLKYRRIEHVRPSTLGRWAHGLRKYRLTAKKGSPFGGPLHNSQAGINDNTTNLARVPLVDYDFDREYYGTVFIGEPPQAFKIDFDTGSSQFIISSKDCKECSGINHYDPSASKTFRTKGQPWHITYGDLSQADGTLGHDIVRVDDIKVHNQQIALVASESSGFDDKIDGIMGLSFGALSTSITSTKTVFENMLAQKLVGRGIFSFYLGKTSIKGGGEVIFGDMDLSRIEPGHTITYTPVTRAKYWQINIENVVVNSKIVTAKPHNKDKDNKDKDEDEDEDNNDDDNDHENKANIHGIVDTGTTLMIVPNKIARQIHRRIAGAKMVGPSWAVPCDLATRTRKEAKVELIIEGKRFGIPFEDVVREATDTAGMCFSAMQSSSASFMIIGDVFIKNNYIVFDQERKRIGIAPLKLEDAP